LLEGEDSDELTIEEKIEEERAKLPTEGLTPVTYESLMAWKQRKAERKQKELEEKMKEEAKKVGGKGSNILSGRALFKYDPNLFQDDEAAADGDVYEERNEDEEEEKKEEDVEGDDKEERKEESEGEDN
jgi:DRG Family Regulatory Proteins, Tma46